MAASGAQNIPDIQQFVADGFQLGYILDFKADSKHTVAAGQILAVELLQADSCGGHGGGNVQQQTVSGEAIQFQSGLKGLLLLVGPVYPYPAGGKPGIVLVVGVGAVCPVNGYAEALGDKAHDGITGNRGAALGELDHARIDVLNDHTVDGMAAEKTTQSYQPQNLPDTVQSVPRGHSPGKP